MRKSENCASKIEIPQSENRKYPESVRSTDEKLFAAWADSLISDKKLANANSRSNAWSIKTDIKTRFQLE